MRSRFREREREREKEEETERAFDAYIKKKTNPHLGLVLLREFFILLLSSNSLRPPPRYFTMLDSINHPLHHHKFMK